MADIFISYAREDRVAAQAVARVLAGEGWSVWWDREISVGSEFDRVIEAELASARCVVVLWSTHSTSSDWVRSEADEGAGRGVLVPAVLEEVAVPLRFRKIQSADLRGWKLQSSHDGLDELIRGVRDKIAGSGQSQVTSVSDEWGCDLLEETKWTRTVRIRRGTDAWTVEFRQHLLGDEVLVDGQLAWKGSTGTERTLEFDLTDGLNRYPTVVFAKTSLVSTQFKAFRVAVAGKVVYREGN
jgi:TIR domain